MNITVYVHLERLGKPGTNDQSYQQHTVGRGTRQPEVGGNRTHHTIPNKSKIPGVTNTLGTLQSDLERDLGRMSRSVAVWRVTDWPQTRKIQPSHVPHQAELTKDQIFSCLILESTETIASNHVRKEKAQQNVFPH